MKRILLFALTLMVGMTLMAQQPHRGPHTPPKPPQIDELVDGLSAVQKKKIETIIDNSRKNVEKLQAELNEVQEQVRKTLDMDGDQTGVLFPLFDREARLKADIAKEMYRTRQQIFKILTDEQAKQFKQSLDAGRKGKRGTEPPHHRSDKKR